MMWVPSTTKEATVLLFVMSILCIHSICVSNKHKSELRCCVLTAMFVSSGGVGWGFSDPLLTQLLQWICYDLLEVSVHPS